MRIRINEDNEELFCVYSKERIELGESYIEVIEDYLGESIIKTYKLEYAEVLVEDEDLYVPEDNVELIEDELGEGDFYEAEGYSDEEDWDELEIRDFNERIDKSIEEDLEE